MIITMEYHSPVGVLILGEYKNQLCLCDWKYRKMRDQIDNRICKFLGTSYEEEHTDFLENVAHQLDEYFAEKRVSFDIPLLFCGTDFQQTVWNKLLEIPYGKTLTYLELSNELSNPEAIRAVASANGANAISIIVPCHRVIGSDGELIGYAGGLDAKKKLLQLEGHQFSNQLELF